MEFGTISKKVSLPTIAVMILAFPRMGQAYVDPGSGSMIWQIAAAGIIASIFYVRRAVLKLRDLFLRSKKNPITPAAQGD